MATVGVGPQEIDVKRSGTFPIVHGVRALAIDKRINAPSTAARIQALVEGGSLEAEFGKELTSALRVFMEFRLRAQLRSLVRGTTEGESVVPLDAITAAERDILRDALRIVRQFRELIRARYNLGAF